MTAHSDDADCTLFCGNISDKVTEGILYELFLQAGPLENVRIPKDNNTGTQKSFAFVTFKHSESVPYTVELMNGIHLYGKPLKLNFKSGSIHEQNRQAHFNRSMSAPNMRHGQYNDNMSNLGASPPFSGTPSLVRNQTYGPGLHNLNQQPTVPIMMSGASSSRDFDNRGNYDRNMDDRQRDRDNDRGRQREKDHDHGGRYNRDSGRNSDYERSRSRGGDDRDNRRRDYEDHGRQRSNDRNRQDNRDRHDHRDRYRQDSSHDRDSRRSGFDTPPQPSRQNRFDISPSGLTGLPLMNPAPQRDMDVVRQSVMASAQQLIMFNQAAMQMRQNQQQGGGRQGGNQRGGRW